MADNFSLAHKFTAMWEDGLSGHPVESGSVTNHGVSLKYLQGVAAESQSNRDILERMGIRLPVTRSVIIDLSKSQASGLFRWQFWDRLKLDRIPLRPAVVIYDAAVNHGLPLSVVFAQRGYNRCVTYGQPLDVDGLLGFATRRAMRETDTDKALMAMLDQREAFFQSIVDKDRNQEVFLHGWLNRLDALGRYVRGL